MPHKGICKETKPFNDNARGPLTIHDALHIACSGIRKNSRATCSLARIPYACIVSCLTWKGCESIVSEYTAISPSRPQTANLHTQRTASTSVIRHLLLPRPPRQQSHDIVQCIHSLTTIRAKSSARRFHLYRLMVFLPQLSITTASTTRIVSPTPSSQSVSLRSTSLMVANPSLPDARCPLSNLQGPRSPTVGSSGTEVPSVLDTVLSVTDSTFMALKVGHDSFHAGRASLLWGPASLSFSRFARTS